MKLIVAGSRSIKDRDWIYRILNQKKTSITEIVCGMAVYWKWDDDPEIGGADRFAHDWAVLNNIPIAKFPADWSRGKGAGMNRNVHMSRYGDALLAFWDGSSTGTDHMIRMMRMLDKPVIVEQEKLKINEMAWFE